MAQYYVGTASFTEAGLMGTFYPEGMKPAERLSFYARHFNVVEIDSSFYGLPSERNSYLYAERTPKDFRIHFKAFGMLTRHPVDVARLGQALAAHLPRDFADRRVSDPPPDMLDKAFQMFSSALMPLKLAGKLGVVLFQYPPYFAKNEDNMGYILECKERLPEMRLAIEFRHGSWLREDEADDTLAFLRENDLPYVCVDEPEFESGATVPPVAEATSSLAYVRFHGRNTDTWFKKGITVSERFDYLYSEDELREWVPRIGRLGETADEIHLLFNNCRRTYPVQNARDIAKMIGALKDKDPIKLVESPSLFTD